MQQSVNLIPEIQILCLNIAVGNHSYENGIIENMGNPEIALNIIG